MLDQAFAVNAGLAGTISYCLTPSSGADGKTISTLQANYIFLTKHVDPVTLYIK